MKKNAWLLFAVVVLSAAALSLVRAQTPSGDSASTPAPPPTSTLSGGTLVAVSPTSIAVKTDPGGQITLVTDSGTIMPAEPKVGDRVDVEYEMGSSGRMRAVRVTAVAAAGSAPSSRSATATPQETASPQGGDARQLPKTASLLPLTVLFGILSILASLALRVSSRPRRRAASIGKLDS